MSRRKRTSCGPAARITPGSVQSAPCGFATTTPATARRAAACGRAARRRPADGPERLGDPLLPCLRLRRPRPSRPPARARRGLELRAARAARRPAVPGLGGELLRELDAV